MRNYAGYKPITNGNAGRPIYVRDAYVDLYKNILKRHGRNYHFTTIMRTIYLLNADGQVGTSLNPAGDAKTITSGNVGMRYNLHDGAVFIQKLVIKRNLVPSKTGLYEVNFDAESREWKPAESPAENLNQNSLWNNDVGKAHYAAVAGRFDNKESASNSLPNHMTSAYQKERMLTKSGGGDSYSLFWSTKGAHKSEQSAQALASVMQQSTKNNLPVNWLVHGDGIHTFKHAAKILKSSPLASISAVERNANAGRVTAQNVYFSNPASNIGEKGLKELCNDAGLTYLGFNSNNRDLRRWKTVKNVGCEMGKQIAGATLAGGGVSAVAVSTVQGFSGGLDKAVTAMVSGFSTGNYAVIGAGVVAGGFAIAGLAKQIKPLAAGIHCTFGKGNEKWYTDDKTLLS